MNTEQMIPMIIVPTTFLFILLIILITKAPKAGAWVVGGLIFLVPILLYRLATTGALRHVEAIPLVVVPVTFLFVLMVILLGKAPKAGPGLIIALAVMFLVGLFLISYHRRVAMERRGPSYGSYRVPQVATIQVEQSAADGSSAAATAQEFERVVREQVQSRVPEPLPLVPVPQVSITPPAASPIWSEGVEQELNADVYPSKLAAARALGLRMDAPLRRVVGEPNASVEVIIFQEGTGRDLVAEFLRSLERKIPDLKCSTEVDLRNIRPGEVGVTFRLDTPTYVVNYSRDARESGKGEEFTSGPVESGGLVAGVFTTGRRATVEARFVEKPWVESFATFASARPDQPFIVARSNGTCTSEAEAHQQALDDARDRIVDLLNESTRHGRFVLPQPQITITATDILQGSFIIDRFAQSFEGSAGKIWRQAMLLDVSGYKLAKLLAQKVYESRRMRETWARMGFSVIGVTVLIGAIYFFLNMATRGYYEWSLRIAGIVLAIVAVISVLMVVR